MDDLQGQRVLIIGGSSGIGLRVAEGAAARGAALVVVARQRERLHQARLQLAARGASVEAESRRVMESKFFTNVRIAQLAASRLRPGGSLVFTAGTGGRAQHACGPYVGNLGLRALVEGAAADLAPRARANAVAPTWTLTPFWRDRPAAQTEATRAHFEQAVPLKRLASIDELAEAFLFLMTNGFITGQVVAVDGGITLGA